MLERVMIIAGESSGELYGALLAGKLKERFRDIRIIGVGGDRMLSSGVELISRISSSFGISEAVKTYSELRKTYDKVIAAIRQFKPQVLVLIDYPDFNIKVARQAKKSGIKVLYYVSPQVWAWRRKRIKTIGRTIDKMAVILPFEEGIYRAAGIPCEFVGHPVLDEIRETVRDSGFGIRDIGSVKLKMEIRKKIGLLPDRPVIVLFPGSRRHEIKGILPVMCGVVKEMKERYPDYQFVVPVAPNLQDNILSDMRNRLKEAAGQSLLITNRSVKALLASDIAVITSGTSTLQAAVLKVPMAVVYKLSPLTYFIARLIVKVKHISLANILLDKSAAGDAGGRFKEFLQEDANKENIVEEIVRILNTPEYRDSMKSQLDKIGTLFFDKEASLRVSEIVEELAER